MTTSKNPQLVQNDDGRLTGLHLRLLRMLSQDPAPIGRPAGFTGAPPRSFAGGTGETVHYVDDIVRALDVSRTSVETALGDLVTWGYIERVEPETDGGVQS